MDQKRKDIRHIKLSILMHARGESQSCKTKRVYRHITHAIEACGKSHGHKLIAYHCLYCGKYHVDERPRIDEYTWFETHHTPSIRYNDHDHFCNMCAGKARFSTRLLAMATSLYHRNNGTLRGTVDVYHCHHCGGWHFGHSAERDMLEGCETA